MKEKDATNVEDILAQLNNSRTQQHALISLYNKINSAKISNVQRTRLLKTVALHCTKDGNSTDLRVAALAAVVPSVTAVFSTSTNPVSGADYYLLETCIKIVQDHIANSNSHHIDIVLRALEIISAANSATLSKLFSEDKASSFKKIMSTYLKVKELRFHALTLLAVGLSVPNSEGLAKSISEDVVPLIELVYPLIFDVDDKNVHSAALKVMKELKLSTKPQPFWNQLKEETQKTYCKRMVEMVNCKANWPEVWKCIVNLFGEELHSGGQLINHMLEVLERAFKHSDFEWTRVQAFECWNTLIDNFKTGLKNRKRIDLIMIPLKANNHRIETLALAKLRTYDHLLATLGKDLVSSPDILTHFLTFCFGSEKTSCPPVKSYPSLHDKCVECIVDILGSPFGEEMFKNSSKEFITAVGECFIMDSASEKLLSQLWTRLLERVSKKKDSDVVKTLLTMINCLVVRAGNKELSGSLKLQLSTSPSKPATNKLNENLGCKIAMIIVQGLSQGTHALPDILLNTRSLYVGYSDVMNGSPALLLMEWLLSPAVMLGAGSLPKYQELISHVLAIRGREFSGYIDFTQTVLKKLLVFDADLTPSKKMLMYKYGTDIWCTLAKQLDKVILHNGSINQGDAAEHDFSGVYSVLSFPVQHLHVDIELVEKCADTWSDLFYEVCQQAELEPTASLQLLCEQICIRLVSVKKKNSPAAQVASIFLFLTCVLEVALKRFKSKKSFKWVQQHVSVIIREMSDLAVDQEVIFNQATKCIEHCLKQTPITMEIVENISPTVCLLLQARTNASDVIGKLSKLLSALKEASSFIQQHGCSKESVHGKLKNVVSAGRNHSSQEIRSIVDDLLNAASEKVSAEEEKKQPVKNKGAASPSSRITFSPKSASKKFPTVQMSPSNLSPGGTKRKLQATICNSDGKFVRIETPPKKIILTEHQKEVRRERRQDIPALYQDLSQDTQSMSQDSTQDFVALPPTPKGKQGPVLDEDAVMDVDELSMSPAKKVASPKSSNKSHVDMECKNEFKSFAPPVGFSQLSGAEDGGSVTDTDNCAPPSGFKQEILTGKENENVAGTPKSLKLSKAPQKGTLTRSSSNKISLTTRSGKIVKRNSLVPEMELQKTRKSSRVSLPATFPEEPAKKGSIETVVLESDTDTESVSSIASETSTGAKLGKPSLRTRRSIKREVSLDSDTDVNSISEKIQPTKKTTDELKNNTPKPLSNKEASGPEPLKKDPEDMPLAKLIGGKILTRSRSNSSLEDIPLSSRLQTSSPDPKEKAMSPIAESNSTSKESPKESGGKSPPKSSSCKETAVVPRTEVSPTNGRKCSGNLVACGSPTRNGSEKSVNALGTNDSSTSKVLKKSGSPGFVRFTLAKHPNEGKHEKKTVQTLSSPISPAVTKEVDDSCVDDPIEFHNGSQDSQEIIESSQEPMMKCLKPCLVGLERFQCKEAHEKVQFENLTIESGPSPSSPYKILKDAPLEGPVKVNSMCRRSLHLEDVEKPSSTEKEVPSSANSTSQIGTNKSSSSSDEITSEKKGKETGQDLSAGSEVNPQVRNDSMPEWMHDKKDSPLTKSQRTIRPASARSSFMKSVTENGISTSPPKAVEISPISSPVQSKRVQKSSMDSTTTPIIKRASRAAQLLGLGQAAAARGGETVVSSASRSLRLEKTNENEETETLCNNGNSTPSSVANPVLGSASIMSTPIASPSVRRHKLLDLESVKSTPQKCLEDKGNKEDWVPKDWVPMATPDSSILKRKREVDSDAPSPSVKRKRVSFRDPPLSKLLRFGETSEGTVFSSDQPTGTEKVTDVVNLDSQNCPPENEEVDLVEESAQLSECRRIDSESKIRENSPQKLKDPVKPSVNSVEKNSPKKSESVSHESEAMKEVVEEKSPQKTLEVLPGKRGRRKVATETVSTHDDTHRSNGEREEEDCRCDDKLQENGGELSEVETQGMLDDLHRMPSISAPICVNLTECTHPVELISSKLTSAVWKKSLLRELSEGGIRTIGDLARLTEEQLDRLPVKPPKRTNVCCVLEDFEKQHPNLTDVTSCKLLNEKNTPHNNVKNSLKDVLINASYEDIMEVLSEAETKSDFCQTMLKSLSPKDVMKAFNTEDFIQCFKPEDLIKNFKPEDLIKNFKPEDLIKNFKPEDLIKNFKPEDLIKNLKPEDLIKNFKPEDLIEHLKPEDLIKHFNPEDLVKNFKLQDLVKYFKADDLVKNLKPEDLVKNFKPKELVKFLKTEDVINSLKAEDVAEAVGSNISIIRSLPVDVCAEAYISQVSKSSGSKEKDMSVEQLTSILNRVAGGTIQSTIFPPVPSILSTVYTDTMRDYVVRECSSSEIVEKLDDKKAQDCALQLLPKLKPKQFAQHLDNTSAVEFTAELLPKLSPSVIADHIDNNKLEETVKALLSKLNKKRGLKFLLEQSVNVFNQLE